jgi:hypothetical protein
VVCGCVLVIRDKENELSSRELDVHRYTHTRPLVLLETAVATTTTAIATAAAATIVALTERY